MRLGGAQIRAFEDEVPVIKELKRGFGSRKSESADAAAVRAAALKEAEETLIAEVHFPPPLSNKLAHLFRPLLCLWLPASTHRNFRPSRPSTTPTTSFLADTAPYTAALLVRWVQREAAADAAAEAYLASLAAGPEQGSVASDLPFKKSATVGKSGLFWKWPLPRRPPGLRKAPPLRFVDLSDNGLPAGVVWRALVAMRRRSDHMR